MPERRYPKEIVSQRGNEIFERSIESQVADRAKLDFVMIDIESGDFEVGPNEREATERLLARHPEAQIYGRRVGSRAAHRIGMVPTRPRRILGKKSI